MKTLMLFLFFVVLVNVAHGFVVSEIGMVDQNDLYRVDNETNPKSKAMCTVHKSTGIWECIMSCIIVKHVDVIEIRQYPFKSCIAARAMIRHMERNPFMAKHINLKFDKYRMSD